MIYNRVLQHVNVESHVESSGPHGRHLPKHHVFCNTMAVVLFSNRSGLHQNFHRLFE
jgi:hypothetical protein